VLILIGMFVFDALVALFTFRFFDHSPVVWDSAGHVLHRNLLDVVEAHVVWMPA
jgi:hypothetical protein